MPANIELCRVRSEYRREEKPNGLFGKVKLAYERVVVEVTDVSGTRIIAQTAEYLLHDSAARPFHEAFFKARAQLDNDRQNLVWKLLNEGWEVMTIDEQGEVTSLKRQITGNPAMNSKSPADLLKQLVSLRDAGILTEVEFQSKKTDVLKRM